MKGYIKCTFSVIMSIVEDKHVLGSAKCWLSVSVNLFISEIAIWQPTVYGMMCELELLGLCVYLHNTFLRCTWLMHESVLLIIWNLIWTWQFFLTLQYFFSLPLELVENFRSNLGLFSWPCGLPDYYPNCGDAQKPRQGRVSCPE